MAGRPGRLTHPRQQLEVARMVRDAREVGVLWKQLAWSLGRSREQLHRLSCKHQEALAREAATARGAGAEKCNTAVVERSERAVA